MNLGIPSFDTNIVLKAHYELKTCHDCKSNNRDRNHLVMGRLVLSFSFDNCKYFSIYNLQDIVFRSCFWVILHLASSMSNIFGICKVLVLIWKFWDIVWHTHVCYGIKLLKLNVDKDMYLRQTEAAEAPPVLYSSRVIIIGRLKNAN